MQHEQADMLEYAWYLNRAGGLELPAGGAARVALAWSETEHIACNRRAARRRGVKVSAPHALTAADLSAKEVGFEVVDGSGASSALTQMATPPRETTSPDRDDCTRTSRSKSSAGHTSISS